MLLCDVPASILHLSETVVQDKGTCGTFSWSTTFAALCLPVQAMSHRNKRGL